MFLKWIRLPAVRSDGRYLKILQIIIKADETPNLFPKHCQQ